MILNHDCVRDLLLIIEEHLHYGKVLKVNELTNQKYDVNDLLYASEKLVEAGFIQAIVSHTLGGEPPTITIQSLTWEGHAYLDNIRPETVWQKTKSVVSVIGSASLHMVSNIASQVISTMIAQQFK